MFGHRLVGRFFSKKTYFLYLFLLASISLSQTVLAESSQAVLDEINADKSKLEEVKVTFFAELQKHQQQTTEDDPFITRHKELLDLYISKVFHGFDLGITQGQLLIGNNQAVEALSILSPIRDGYKTVLGDFDVISKTIRAEYQAERTQYDSKMFFMMKMGATQIPSKTLKAYGLMGLAKRTRDQGDYAQAIQQWQQAEDMVKDDINDYIANGAKWLENAKQEAEVREARIKADVEAILKGHMIVIPAGQFLMGSETDGTDEKPVHKVNIKAFKLGETEVTFKLWDLCVENTSCYNVPHDQGWGRDQHPVINVSHRDIYLRFLPWLKKITGKNYRLPTEAEWEYAARAGTKSEYTWGDNLLCSMARYDGGVTSACSAQEKGGAGSKPVKSYKSNGFGLFDMHGNVWEWVEDCWANNYDDTPRDGSANVSGNCAVRVLRGGSWDFDKNGLRSPNRYYAHFKTRTASYGFRLALDAE